MAKIKDVKLLPMKQPEMEACTAITIENRVRSSYMNPLLECCGYKWTTLKSDKHLRGIISATGALNASTAMTHKKSNVNYFRLNYFLCTLGLKSSEKMERFITDSDG